MQSLFRILLVHTVSLRCANSLELPQNGFLRGNHCWADRRSVWNVALRIRAGDAPPNRFSPNPEGAPLVEDKFQHLPPVKETGLHSPAYGIAGLTRYATSALWRSSNRLPRRCFAVKCPAFGWAPRYLGADACPTGKIGSWPECRAKSAFVLPPAVGVIRCHSMQD